MSLFDTVVKIGTDIAKDSAKDFVSNLFKSESINQRPTRTQGLMRPVSDSQKFLSVSQSRQNDAVKIASTAKSKSGGLSSNDIDQNGEDAVELAKKWNDFFKEMFGQTK